MFRYSTGTSLGKDLKPLIRSFNSQCGSTALHKGQGPYCELKERIKGFKSLPKDVPVEYLNIYLEKWNKNECKQNNHSMFFKHTYGVIGICETCYCIQPFNLSHPC
jgi:hypothetical protein